MNLAPPRLTRRAVLGAAVVALLPRILRAADPSSESTALTRDWLPKWEPYILSSARDRYCDRETGEELGWLVSPHVNGFYYGYLAMHDTRWIDRLIDWSDSWVHRGIKEPDGRIGWPKAEGASTKSVPDLFTDNILGEAMALTPMVLMAGQILKSPPLTAKYGGKARSYLRLSEDIFAKWDARGCWREIEGGGVWIVPLFGIDPSKNAWTDGYDRRQTEGFTLPPNKQNLLAQWLMAMHDVIGKPPYRERATQWWQIMKSRMRIRDGKYFVWNYWEPAGPWDHKPDGSLKHWVGVHPNGGYYNTDVDGIVTAFEHGLVFDRADLDRLISTNRDYMWNQQVRGAQFRRIDGGEAQKPWEKTPGVLWEALVRHDAKLREIFETNHNPASWGGLVSTPRYLVEVSGRIAVGGRQLAVRKWAVGSGQ